MAKFEDFIKGLESGEEQDLPMARKNGFRANLHIDNVEKLQNSISGNPRYKLYVKDIDSGTLYEGKTAPDGSIGYELPWNAKGGKIRVSAHRTPKGEVVFDYGKYFQD